MAIAPAVALPACERHVLQLVRVGFFDFVCRVRSATNPPSLTAAAATCV